MILIALNILTAAGIGYLFWGMNNDRNKAYRIIEDLNDDMTIVRSHLFDLHKKVDGIDENILDGSLSASSLKNEIRKIIEDEVEQAVEGLTGDISSLESKVEDCEQADLSEVESRLDTLEQKIDKIRMAFSSLSSELED